MATPRVAFVAFLLGIGACDGSPFTRATGKGRDASVDASERRPSSGGNVGQDAGTPVGGRGGATSDDSGTSAGGDAARQGTDDSGAGGAPGSGGVSGSGGARNSGGSVGSGGVEASGGAAGRGGVAGSGGGKGSGGGPTNVFPATPVLDNFGRLALGANWIGATDAYAISSGKLGCTLCDAPVLWSHDFGASQEAYFTIAGFDVASNELNVVLKAQSTDCNQIEILYAPNASQIRVDYCFDGRWRQQASVAWTLHIGDRFGGRAHADGTVEVFVNGDRVAVYNLADYPFARGRIGVSGIAATGTLNTIDDFGGGDF